MRRGGGDSGAKEAGTHALSAGPAHGWKVSLTPAAPKRPGARVALGGGAHSCRRGRKSQLHFPRRGGAPGPGSGSPPPPRSSFLPRSVLRGLQLRGCSFWQGGAPRAPGMCRSQVPGRGASRRGEREGARGGGDHGGAAGEGRGRAGSAGAPRGPQGGAASPGRACRLPGGRALGRRRHPRGRRRAGPSSHTPGPGLPLNERAAANGSRRRQRFAWRAGE